RRGGVGGRRKPNARRQPARLDPGTHDGYCDGNRHGPLRPRHGLWHCSVAARRNRRWLADLDTRERRSVMNNALLHASGISVRRGGRVALQPTDFAARAGETVGIYGPNGAGKSTLLLALAGLLPLASGTIALADRVLGRDLTPLAYHRRIAAVF